MRFNTPIFFQLVKAGAYDANTGNYGADTITEVKKYAAVTEADTQTMQIMYGKIKQGSLVIRLQMPYKEPFDRIRIGKKLYTVDRFKKPSNKQVFFVSEVQQ